MSFRTLLVLAAAVLVAASPAIALNPDDELWVPAAVRGEGGSGSYWITDLYLMSLAEEEITVEVTWLERFADNSDAEGVELVLGPGETLVLADVVLATFGEESAAGAIHLEVLEEAEEASLEEEDEGEEDDAVLVAAARIYNLDGGETHGQGFEGLTSAAAISADGDDVTHVVGISHNSAYRTNWFGLNLSEGDDDEPAEGLVSVEVLDLAGDVIASQSFTLPPMAPVLYSVADLGVSDLDAATLRFTMIEGEGLFGASKIDELSNDPTTLEAHWECDDDEGEDEFSDEFMIESCTFATTGRNPFWIPLVVGWTAEYEGEEDGEEVGLTITVLDETMTVDGVETRVVEEYETVDGEVAEISRNYFAFCTETGSVFYFGESVDIYEDGEVVSHDGAWMAGVDGARAGIIMPGTVLLGSRYFQEVAPGVALDRAEHTAMGLTVETEAGTFEGCLRVDETTPLEPGDLSVKLYAPEVGLVVDDILELVEVSDPGEQ